MKMPPPDNAILNRRETIAEGLRHIVGEAHVMDDEASLKAYETDALSAYRQMPMLVVLPGDTGEVSRVLAFCKREGVKIVPRGAGTGLSGGALPLEDGITSASAVSIVSLRSITPTARPWSSQVWPISRSVRRWMLPAFITHPIRRVR